MRIKHLFFLLLLIPSLCFSQTRTISDVTEEKNPVTTGDIYAFIVGISSYPYIKPLSYADKDAELFRDFLKSNAGGNVKDDNITFLPNERATYGAFITKFTKFVSKKYN